MTVVADSSPLVILTKLGCFQLLNRFFPRVYISAEVQYEVVIAGAGLPGASEVSKAEWIEVKRLQNQAVLASAQGKHGLGAGEMSTILLAKELSANPVLLDDYKARKLAKSDRTIESTVLSSCCLMDDVFIVVRTADGQEVHRSVDLIGACVAWVKNATDLKVERVPAGSAAPGAQVSLAECCSALQEWLLTNKRLHPDERSDMKQLIQEACRKQR